MATVTAYTSVNMDSPSIWYGWTYGATSSRIVITDYSNHIAAYDGTSFKYSKGALVGGTLQGYSQYAYSDLSPEYLVTGLSLNAKTVYSYVQSGQATKLYAYALSGNDTINGSTQSDFLRGLAGNDRINGRAGADTIFGDTGNDTLTGGLGTDFFVFNTALSATTNKDTITDFNVVDDTIKLENAIMTKLGANGTLTTSQFKKGAGFKSGKDADDHIIYNTTTGALYYDSNGSGAGGSVQIALIGASSTHAALTYADFVVI
jgi:Ca2+-binding RTX toxin-like protein